MIQYVAAITNNKDVQNLNDAVYRVFTSLYPNPLLNSPQIIKDLSFSAGADLWIDHKLGRAVNGYIVTKSNAATQVYTSPTINAINTVRICLRASVTATVDILFF